MYLNLLSPIHLWHRRLRHIRLLTLYVPFHLAVRQNDHLLPTISRDLFLEILIPLALDWMLTVTTLI